MMRSVLLVLILALGATAPLAAEAPAAMVEAFSAGNQAYAEENYADAVEAYRTALTHGDSPELHYNLGNAHVQLRQWGPAVLHYRKALALDPQHVDARANLLLTRREAGLPESTLSWWQRWAENLPLSIWAIAASIAAWLLLAIWILGRRFDAPRLKLLLTLVALPVLVAAAPALYGYHLAGQSGVVLLDAAPLRVAPTAQSPSTQTLTAGLGARLRKTANGFYLVELRDGEEGYLAPDEFQPVWDSAPQL